MAEQAMIARAARAGFRAGRQEQARGSATMDRQGRGRPASPLPPEEMARQTALGMEAMREMSGALAGVIQLMGRDMPGAKPKRKRSAQPAAAAQAQAIAMRPATPTERLGTY